MSGDGDKVDMGRGVRGGVDVRGCFLCVVSYRYSSEKKKITLLYRKIHNAAIFHLCFHFCITVAIPIEDTLS